MPLDFDHDQLVVLINWAFEILHDGTCCIGGLDQPEGLQHLFSCAVAHDFLGESLVIAVGLSEVVGNEIDHRSSLQLGIMVLSSFVTCAKMM